MKLTRKDQVLAVLRAGGYAVTSEPASGRGFGIASLFDVAGVPVDAWQTAIVSNLRPSQCTVAHDGDTRTWRLK